MGFFDLFGRAQKSGADEAVLVQLEKAGANLSKLHTIEFFLYFPTQAAAEQAADQVRKDGFRAEVEPAAQGSEWLCFVTKRMAPTLQDLEKIRHDFEAITSALHGQYDGWGTPVEE
jgi:regulator of RNase E activity RraB